MNKVLGSEKYAIYSVKSVVILRGLSADTLHAWVRRYQVVTPSRDKNVVQPQQIGFVIDTASSR